MGFERSRSQEKLLNVSRQEPTCSTCDLANQHVRQGEEKKKLAETSSGSDRMEPKKIDLDTPFWKRSVNGEKPIEFRLQAESERDSFGAFGARIYNAETSAPQSGEAVETQRIQPGGATDSDIPLTTVMLRNLSHQWTHFVAKNFIDDALGIKGKYDYLHLPAKLDTKKTMGVHSLISSLAKMPWSLRNSGTVNESNLASKRSK